MGRKNYYEILDISAQASQDEVRGAFRRLIKRYHPDGEEGDEETCHELYEAYGVLSDPRKRRHYDMQRRRPAPAFSHMGGGQEYSSMHMGGWQRADSFESLFEMLFRAASPREYVAASCVVPITPQQSRSGGSVEIPLTFRRACHFCGGVGRRGVYQCGACNGEGSSDQQVAIELRFPLGINDGDTMALRLDRFGIPGGLLEVLFRIKN